MWRCRENQRDFRDRSHVFATSIPSTSRHTQSNADSSLRREPPSRDPSVEGLPSLVPTDSIGQDPAKLLESWTISTTNKEGRRFPVGLPDVYLRWSQRILRRRYSVRYVKFRRRRALLSRIELVRAIVILISVRVLNVDSASNDGAVYPVLNHVDDGAACPFPPCSGAHSVYR